MTAASLPARRGAPALDPDGLVASTMLAFIATAGLFYVNIMSALVSGLQGGLAFSARDAGLVASLNVYGAAAGALAAVFVVARLPWRQTSLGVLAAMVAVDLLSILIHTPLALMAARFGHGLLGGFLVGIAFSVIARQKAPDRTFGLLLVVQFGLGGLGLLLLPGLVPQFGAKVLFLALAAFSVCAVAMLPFLGDYPRKPPVPGAPVGVVSWRLLAAALLAVFLFQGANMGIAAYAISLGRAYGLTLRHISDTLAVANWIGAMGSVLVVVVGLRWGRTKPILFGIAATLVGMLAFLKSDLLAVFAAANIITSIVWAFVIPYLLGLCAAFDPGGRAAAMAGFFSKMGLASGPALGGLLLAETHFSRLVWLALAGLVLAAAAAAVPARHLDHVS